MTSSLGSHLRLDHNAVLENIAFVFAKRMPKDTDIQIPFRMERHTTFPSIVVLASRAVVLIRSIRTFSRTVDAPVRLTDGREKPLPASLAIQRRPASRVLLRRQFPVALPGARLCRHASTVRNHESGTTHDTPFFYF